MPFGPEVYVLKCVKPSIIFSKIITKDLPGLKQLIKSNKKNMGITNSQGDSLLHIAVANNFPEAVMYLLHMGMNINKKNIKGETALHIAANLGLIRILEILIAKKADFSAKNKNNKTPFEVAKENNKDLFCYSMFNIFKQDIHCIANDNIDNFAKIIQEMTFIRLVRQIPNVLMLDSLPDMVLVSIANYLLGFSERVATELFLYAMCYYKNAKNYFSKQPYWTSTMMFYSVVREQPDRVMNMEKKGLQTDINPEISLRSFLDEGSTASAMQKDKQIRLAF